MSLMSTVVRRVVTSPPLRNGLALRPAAVTSLLSFTPSRYHSTTGCGGDHSDRAIDEVKKYAEQLDTDPDLAEILENNKAWVRRQNEEDPKYFERLGAPQTPKYLYIGCADSRVDPTILMGLGMGQMFVHRNVGNQVCNNDMNMLAVVEYAVQVLQVPHIIVCGHYDCGAVRGSIAKPRDHSEDGPSPIPLVEHWVRGIRDVARLHKDILFKIEDDEARCRKLVELNVMEQCLNVFKIGPVQRSRARSYESNSKAGKTSRRAYPRIHGVVFDPKEGILNKLDVDFAGEIDKYRGVYDLYHINEDLQ